MPGCRMSDVGCRRATREIAEPLADKRMKDEFGGFADVVDVLKTELEKTDPENKLFKYKSSNSSCFILYKGLRTVK